MRAIIGVGIDVRPHEKAAHPSNESRISSMRCPTLGNFRFRRTVAFGLVGQAEDLLVISPQATNLFGKRWADPKNPHQGAKWMKPTAWLQVTGDLASTRRAAAVFLDNLEEFCGAVDQQNWVARWINIGDAHALDGDLKIKKGAFDRATDAWLCALTAFEVARRLVEQGDARCGEVSAKVEAGIHRLRLSLTQKVERVPIACCEWPEFLAHFVSASRPDLCAPAVICISQEQETGPTLLGRLLPVVIGRGVSVLVVSHDDVSNQWRHQSEMLLSCCLDYLSARPDVDATRVGVYGDGLSAVLATDFAVSDRRVASAVCDGGLWNWSRLQASVRWMTRTAHVAEEEITSARRSRIVRQLRCPILVVADGRGAVSVSEAIKLQADCWAACIDLDLAMPRMARIPTREIENFVASDDCIFGWLEHKLIRNSVGFNQAKLR
ncbi:alpha/beta hydrolase family protein [Bradyrhizobium niftali]|uniref:Uncharacterized protein n=1 Tax=Bradyrhizobium niftali TaxID=2560055 RepID=A0A4Y9L1A5_9BRAD|nr:hypothetical protein [Bradyrhizobium niftali]TFV35843.1 hypothetical protein E4K65_46305 [Bradyrhizobium niftali]